MKHNSNHKVAIRHKSNKQPSLIAIAIRVRIIALYAAINKNSNDKERQIGVQ